MNVDMDFLIPIGLFALIAAIVIVPQILRARERERMHQTLRLAYEKGQPVPPELIDALQSKTAQVAALPIDRSARDLRAGVVWLFVGLGFLTIGLIGYFGLYNSGGSVAFLATFASFGAIPAFVGLAFLILSYFGRQGR